MELLFSEPSGPMFHYKPPTNESLGDEPLLSKTSIIDKNEFKIFHFAKHYDRHFILDDPLDDHYVETRPYSSIPGAGEGLYAKVDISKGTKFVIYSGFALSNENKDELKKVTEQLAEQGFRHDHPVMEAVWKYRLLNFMKNFKL